MARFHKKTDKRVGLGPGSFVFVGSQKEEEPRIRLIDYELEQLTEKEITDSASLKVLISTKTVSWINIDGIHDIDLMKNIASSFEFHPLLVDDILNTGQRPKIVLYDDMIFIVMKMLAYDESSHRIQAEQVSMVFGKNFILTFQEQRGDVFEPVRNRIRRQKGRIRVSGVDYLAYALMDVIVDNYNYIIERMGEMIEELEVSILSDPTPDIMEEINDYKREMIYLRKSIRPIREAVQNMIKSDNDLLHSENIPFYRDLEDHVTHALETVDNYRDMLSDQLNIYNSVVSNRMNDIMKVLTIFAAIFIPLTFIAGVYGTNFEYLPELQYRYSYFVFWGVLLVVGGIMLGYFRRKKWL
ncbi:MAG: magnesium/cobalt transporter CorA [Candidatus Marinimicrobia bacterium]|nr:magnesium/cobalt transporter CorA [Candidatus Neomarinimicrobiota bacterium]MCF7850717.1 magnesium/cobalt transporter CorA [Candidatus Neomarinimicrobiota bacterium]